jgi:nucleotide-binding universal stress UspA family protein
VVVVALRELIVGCNGGPASRDALRFAAVLARVDSGRLILVNVHRHGHRDEALRLLDEAERSLPYGTRAAIRPVESRSAANALHELAETEAADMIVIGPRRNTRGQSTFVTGAHCPVAIAPAGFADDTNPGLRVIGVGFDGSPEAQEALDVAARIAVDAGATIRLIGVAHAPPRPVVGTAMMYVPDADFDYRAVLLGQLEDAADELPVSLRAQVILADGEAADELLERADPLSLLVLGSRGYGPFRRALLGSVSAQVLRSAPCPLLVVPRAAQRAAPERAAAEAAA